MDHFISNVAVSDSGCYNKSKINVGRRQQQAILIFDKERGGGNVNVVCSSLPLTNT